jgi:hypothetical protein
MPAGFADELCPVPLMNRKTKQPEPWAADEHMRPEDHRGRPRQTRSGLQEGRRGHRGQRLRHRRRGRRLHRGLARLRRRSAACVPSAGWWRGEWPAFPRDHGHRSGSRGAPGRWPRPG